MKFKLKPRDVDAIGTGAGILLWFGYSAALKKVKEYFYWPEWTGNLLLIVSFALACGTLGLLGKFLSRKR